MKDHNFLMRGIFSLFLLITLLNLDSLPVKAQAPDTGDDIVTLQNLGEHDVILSGPRDSRDIFFRLPANWAMLEDSNLHLNLNSITSSNLDTNTNAVGFLEVYLNDTWLQTINITTEGDNSVDIPIPASAWDTEAGASQKLRFTLVDALDCDFWLYAAKEGSARGLSTVLRSSSYVDLKHAAVPVPTDLTLFPFPIFQNSFLPDQAVLVIPDNATQGEMQAAMTLSAALGRLTNGKLNLSLVTSSQLNDTLIEESHLIFIGSPAAFPQLESANLPAPYSGTNFSNVQMGSEDGILQSVISPQNPSKVWLLVSGNNDAGIIKAAQATGSDQIQPYGPENIAVISAVGTKNQNSSQTDFTFSDLGYPFEQTYTGNYNDLAVWFDMPVNRSVSDGAYFDMVFANSASLDFDASDVKVVVNNNLVGGLRFTDRTTSLTHWKFNIPGNLLHPGRNLLLLQVQMKGSSPCINLDELWFSINPDSLLHLPTSEMNTTTQEMNLANYPNSMFSTFGQTAFILPSNDTSAWSVASKLAFDLGKSLGGNDINIPTYYADAVPDEILRSKDLVLVGRPSAMPMIAEFSQVMPAPFESGRDIPQQKDSQYSFVVSDSVPAGYIQLFSSPLDAKKSVLTVLGNKEEGLEAAATALLSPASRGQMAGNYIVVLKNKIIVQKISEKNPQSSPEVILPADQNSAENVQPGNKGKFNLSLPLIVSIVAGVLVIVGLVVMFILDKEERRNKAAESSSEQNWKK